MELEEIISNIKNLPPTPQILPKLKELLKDGNSSVNDILTLIKVDQALAAQIVRASNSPFYGAVRPSGNLEEAISRIGFNEVYKLVAFVAASHVLGGSMEIYGYKANELFHQSITCATIMQMMAQSGAEDSDTAYTIGLMHAIGKVVISHYCIEEEIVLTLNASKTFNHNDEVEQLGFHYAQAGAALLRHWRFHDDVAVPLECQFRPTSNAHHLRSSCMLSVAKDSIQHIQNSPQRIGDALDPPEEILEHTGIGKDELITAVIAAKAALHDIHDLLEAV